MNFTLAVPVFCEPGRIPVVWASDGSTDDEPHDLRGSGEDAMQPGSGVEPRDRIFVHVPGAAVQLHALIDDAPLHFLQPHLGHGASSLVELARADIISDHV